MPVYEYKCSTCDFSFEQRQGFDAEPICSCPQCRNEARRQFRPAPIIFKGSGFYVTDYPNNSGNAARNRSSEGEKEPVAAAPEASDKSESSDD